MMKKVKDINREYKKKTDKNDERWILNSEREGRRMEANDEVWYKDKR